MATRLLEANIKILTGNVNGKREMLENARTYQYYFKNQDIFKDENLPNIIRENPIKSFDELYC